MTTPTPTDSFWSRLAALTRKEMHQLLRDRSNLAMGIVLPIVLILIFGYGMSFDVKDVRVAVVLEDRSPTATEVLAGLELSAYITPVVVTSMHDAERLMLKREVDGIVRVPSDFSRQLNLGDAGLQAKLQIIVHGVDANRARAIQTYVQAALGRWRLNQADRAGQVDRPGRASGAASGAVVLENRMWFNAANNSTWYLVPGLIVMIVTIVGAFLTALVMAREWERGTLESLFVTPVRPTEILVAKIIPYFGVGMIGVALCLLAARFLFNVPIQGSLLVILFSSVLYLLVALGLGLVISSATKNQFLASQVALLASFLPALMLSGFIFDLRNMPAVISAVGHVLPATYYIELLKGLFLAGNVWPLIFRNCTILAIYAVVLLSLARLLTRKKIA